MKALTLLLLTVPWLALAPLPAAAQQTADLRPRLTPGQVDRFDFHQEGHLTLTVPDVPGAGAEQTMTQEMRIALRVQEATDQGAKGTITFERLALTMTGGGMDVSFDSDNPPRDDADNPVAPMLRPMIGKSIGVTFDESGNITSLSGLDNLLPAGVLGDLVGSDALKGQVARVTALGEGAAVRRVGERWTSKDIIELPEGGGKLEMTTKHHLKRVRGAKAMVTIEADMASTGNKEGLKIRESSLEGEYVWDTERGMVESLEFDELQEFDIDRSGVKARIRQDVRRTIKRIDSPERE